ncbi:MAG TPA: OsmC family protein [Gaiellaceae bacterium]|nr:OsmC family protein [Gaiellaceae bacterium]
MELPSRKGDTDGERRENRRGRLERDHRSRHGDGLRRKRCPPRASDHTRVTIWRPRGKTSPEELIAPAHAGCFTMALGSVLARRGTPPERLEVSARVTLETSGAPRIKSSELDVHGVVPGSD